MTRGFAFAFFGSAFLQCSAEIEGDWGGKPPPIQRYVDLSYYEKARHRVGH